MIAKEGIRYHRDAGCRFETGTSVGAGFVSGPVEPSMRESMGSRLWEAISLRVGYYALPSFQAHGLALDGVRAGKRPADGRAGLSDRHP